VIRSAGEAQQHIAVTRRARLAPTAQVPTLDPIAVAVRHRVIGLLLGKVIGG
jgi:hypothetical protein